MAVTYTNNEKTNISDPFRALLWAEFAPIDVVLDDGFDPARMTRGEYIRYYFLDSNEVSKHSDGETRDYTLELVYYFDTERYRTKKAFDEVYSDRSERAKATIEQNRYYDDGTYRWHNMTIESDPIQSVAELEDIENEATMAARFTITITRNNYW